MADFSEAAARAGLAFERFDAVDTRTPELLDTRREFVKPEAFAALAATLKRGHRRSHEELTSGAVGCALSHAAASREGLRRDLPLLAVFEDDAEVPQNTAEIIALALRHAPTAAAAVAAATRSAAAKTEDRAVLRVPAPEAEPHVDWDMILLGWWDRGSGADSSRSSRASSHLPSDVGSTRAAQSLTRPGGFGGSLVNGPASDPPLVRVGRFWGCHAYLVSARGMGRLAAFACPVELQVGKGCCFCCCSSWFAMTVGF